MERGGGDFENMPRQGMEAALREVLRAPGLAAPAYAVVVPVVAGVKEAELLIEVRAKGISQAGDPCFPGGRIERGETPAQAAAREMGEELDIHVDPRRFLGQLPTVNTVLGSRTDVFVCTVSPEEAAAARPNPAEVAKLLRVPVSFFLARRGAMDFAIGGEVIWGMTAGAIRHFCRAWMEAFGAEPYPGRPC